MRLATDLHSGLARRQPLPRRFRIPFDDTPRIFAAHTGTRTNHGTFQPCAGTSVASVSSFIAGASQIIIIRPAAFVQRTGKTTFAGLRSVRLRGKRSRLWCRRLGSNQRHTSWRGALPTELRLRSSPARIARETPGSFQRIDRRSSCLRGGAYINLKGPLRRWGGGLPFGNFKYAPRVKGTSESFLKNFQE